MIDPEFKPNGQIDFIPPAAEDYISRFEAGLTDEVSAQRYGAERREGSNIEGRGLFATEDIPAGTIIAIKPGRLLTEAQVKELADVIQHSQQQIGEDIFLAGTSPEEVDSNLVGYNHSCDPNAKVIIPNDTALALLVSRQDIKVGQEITVDYAVSQASDTHQIFGCRCGSPYCRQIISPRWDWLKPEVQQKYAGEFPLFIQNRIDDLTSLNPTAREALLGKYGRCVTSEMIAFIQDILDKDRSDLQVIDNEYFGRPRKLSRPVLRTLLRLRGITASLLSERGQELRTQIKDFESLQDEYLKLFIIVSPFNTGNEVSNNGVLKDHRDLVLKFALGWDRDMNEPGRVRALSIAA